MSDNTAWLANLKVGDEVGVQSTMHSMKIGIVKRTFGDYIDVNCENANTMFNKSDGKSTWTLYGKSQLISATDELKESLKNQERRWAACSIVENAEYSDFSIETLERIAAIIQEEQAK